MQRSYIIISLCWLLSLRRHLRIHLDTKIFEANPFHEASQSVSECVLPTEDHDIETQRKRREFCMSLDLDSHFINSHQPSWTLMDSQKISTLPRHGHAAVEAVRYSHLGSRISRKRKETEQENAGNNICCKSQTAK
jgi:hypothetical protein